MTSAATLLVNWPAAMYDVAMAAGARHVAVEQQLMRHRDYRRYVEWASSGSS